MGSNLSPDKQESISNEFCQTHIFWYELGLSPLSSSLSSQSWNPIHTYKYHLLNPHRPLNIPFLMIQFLHQAREGSSGTGPARQMEAETDGRHPSWIAWYSSNISVLNALEQLTALPVATYTWVYLFRLAEWHLRTSWQGRYPGVRFVVIRSAHSAEERCHF